VFNAHVPEKSVCAKTTADNKTAERTKIIFFIML
jgi:hypothetical protein